MNISFTKYHGTGNDFIMIDDREKLFPAQNSELIAQLCHRRFGIGADGLILIQNHEKLDFEMKYFNSDGLEGSMCGNGGRCAVHFASKLGLADNETRFHAVDGIHEASINNESVKLAMQDVAEIKEMDGFLFLDTGSPHVVIESDDVDRIDIVHEGQKIRYNKELFPEGTNVNFIQFLEKKHLKIRTYERGVENETWSCGTGAVASAIVAVLISGGQLESPEQVKLDTKGGSLEVSFSQTQNRYHNIHLTGPAKKVFEGTVQI